MTDNNAQLLADGVAMEELEGHKKKSKRADSGENGLVTLFVVGVILWLVAIVIGFIFQAPVPLTQWLPQAIWFALLAGVWFAITRI